METSAEQRLFRETNSDFVSETAAVSAVRKLHTARQSFDRDWWSQATELGWTSLLVPEELGGGSASGEGVVDLASLAELLGSEASPGPLNTVSVVLAGLTHPRAEGQHGAVIEAIMTGEQVATWAVAAPRRGWNPYEPSVTTTRVGEEYILNGVAGSVEFAPDADLFLVTARSESGLVQVLVDAGAAGVTIESTGSVDLLRTFGNVTFSDVASSRVVARGDDARAVIERQALIANLLQVAETVGGVGSVFDFTVQWGFDRYSFGRPLVSYQALKHRYADMKLWLEACRATLAAAVAAVQAESPDAPHLVSVAKSYVTERSVQIIQDCVQLHGGLGVTTEHNLHIYLRRAMLDRQLYGSPREHRELVAQYIGL